MIRRALSLAVNTARLHRDPVRYFRSQGVEIGEGVEIFGANLFTFGSEPYLVSIGNQVTISHNVDFITHDGGMRVADLSIRMLISTGGSRSRTIVFSVRIVSFYQARKSAQGPSLAVVRSSRGRFLRRRRDWRTCKASQIGGGVYSRKETLVG